MTYNQDMNRLTSRTSKILRVGLATLPIFILGLVVLSHGQGVRAVAKLLIFTQPRTSQSLSPPPRPEIIWSQQQVGLTLSSGETLSKDVTFTSSLNLHNIIISTSPEIARFVTIQPSSFANIMAGQPQSLHLSFFAPPETSLGTFEGEIYIQSGNQRISQTLKVPINVWQSATGNGLMLNYPPEWQLNPHPLALGGPIALNTFENNYRQGGIIPVEGAEINIAKIPLPSLPLTDIITEELSEEEAIIQSSDTILVAGSVGTRVFYRSPITSTLEYSNIAVYLPHGSLLYKFFLSYNAGDPFEPQFNSRFQEILNSVQFSQ